MATQALLQTIGLPQPPPNTKLKNNLQDLSAATFYGSPTIHYVKIERLLDK